MPIHNRKHLEQNRKELRNHGTAAEATLWLQLQRSQLDGRKFRRQHSIGNYIVDFYCPAEKLAVELDGATHYNEDAYASDQRRTAYLNDLGIKVIRFENCEVYDNMPEVLERIKMEFVGDSGV